MRGLATLVLVGAICAPAGAQEIGDAAAGHAFARDLCAECHWVEAAEPETLNSDIKPFRDIAADPKITQMALRAFLRTPHRRMPDFLLSRSETDDVIAYILSLRPR